jgi:hypothetical protein
LSAEFTILEQTSSCSDLDPAILGRAAQLWPVRGYQDLNDHDISGSDVNADWNSVPGEQKPMAEPNQLCDPPDSTSATGANAPFVTAEPPTEQQVGLFLNNLLTQPVVQQSLAGVRYRVLFARAIENLDKDASQTQTGRWSAQIYDYTNNQTLEVAADFPLSTNASVTPLTTAYGLIVQVTSPISISDETAMRARDAAEMNALATIRNRVYRRRCEAARYSEPLDQGFA